MLKFRRETTQEGPSKEGYHEESNDSKNDLIITYFRATLISRIQNKNISQDFKFAILMNHRFKRQLNFANQVTGARF